MHFCPNSSPAVGELWPQAHQWYFLRNAMCLRPGHPAKLFGPIGHGSKGTALHSCCLFLFICPFASFYQTNVFSCVLHLQVPCSQVTFDRCPLVRQGPIQKDLTLSSSTTRSLQSLWAKASWDLMGKRGKVGCKQFARAL